MQPEQPARPAAARGSMATAICLFCEDIRQEVSNTVSLVGVMPPAIQVAQVPEMLPKLGLYLRVRTPLEQPPSRLRAWLETPWDEVSFPFVEITEEELRRELDRIRSSDHPTAFDITVETVLTPFEIRSAGKLTAVLEIDGLVLPVGSLGIEARPAEAQPADPGTVQESL